MLALLPCVVSFAAAASACEKAAQWQFALELLKEAKQAKSQTRIDVNLLQWCAICGCSTYCTVCCCMSFLKIRSNVDLILVLDCTF